jgi:hypothetical protein
MVTLTLRAVLERGLDVLARRADDVVAHFRSAAFAVAAGQGVENGAMLGQGPNPLRRVAEDELAGGVHLDALELAWST